MHQLLLYASSTFGSWRIFLIGAFAIRIILVANLSVEVWTIQNNALSCVHNNNFLQLEFKQLSTSPLGS
jgi:hypothetical protein